MKINGYSLIRQASAGGVATAARSNVRRSCKAPALSRGSAKGRFNVGKVVRIRAAIADGVFKVDAGKVADALIELAKDRIQKRK